ncbi:pentatricopeptide repeat-containing protein [Prunus yedoensis var. nudiflora]|uniref:Pentatricopeptide repeat-containing protein n=1 Tax=Prunus yedoensis var. nudiflora TaxID=2094558 RepID=A0A314YT23_PRUYE|nr:pentatricopeptide repeat-containing protein [Prunus yedoensis var. nudiflora]
MQTLYLAIQRRFVQAKPRTVYVPYFSANKISSSFKNFLCTQTPNDFTEKVSESKPEESRSCLSYRIEKLPNGEPVGSAFQSWMGDGFPIHRGDIFHAINRLRKLKLNKRALEVMEWVIRERPYRPKELDYSYLLEFTTKFHGISQGKELFTRVPLEFQNELLYNNLVIACLDKGAIRLPLEFDCENPSQMRADKVVLHASTFNILMKIEANEYNIEGLMKVYSDMKRAKVEPNEISHCIVATAHAVARLYTAAEAYVEALEKSVTGSNWST